MRRPEREAVETALTTDGYSQFGSDISTLMAIEKLSLALKSLEEPRPLSDTSHIKYLLGRYSSTPGRWTRRKTKGTSW